MLAALRWCVLLLLLCDHHASGQGLSFRTPQDCAVGDQRLKRADLACTSCPATAGGVATTGLGCQCRVNAYATDNTVSGEQGGILQCLSCAANEVVAQGSVGCIACTDASTTFDTTQRSCTCADSSHVQVDRSVTGQLQAVRTCQACDTGYEPASSDPFRCVPCPDEAMVPAAGDPCSCPSGTVKAGSRCVDNAAEASANLQQQNFVITFPNSGVQVESALFQDTLLAAFALCSDVPRNGTACQQLANLCVLELYSTNSRACQLYTQLANAAPKFVHGFADWPAELPWLLYSAGSTADRATDLAVKASFSQTEFWPVPASTSQLAFVLAAYNVHGDFLGFSNLTSQLQLCEATPSFMSSFLRFGVLFDNTCQLNLEQQFAELPSLVFYDFYVMDVGQKLYPLPVLVSNSQGDVSQRQFTRRLFVVDAVSGLGEDALSGGSSQLRAVRLAKSISLRITLDKGTSGRIFPPVLEITYGDVAYPFQAGATAQATFSVTYESSFSDYQTDMTIVLVVFAFVAFVVFAIRLAAWRSKNRALYIDFRTLVYSIIGLGEVYAGIVFWVLFGSSLYWLIFYQGQSDVTVLLSTDAGQDLFRAMLVIVFVFKALAVVYLIFWQCNIDIFFLDWEIPRGGQVSVWRPYFIVNEWNELQTFRKTHLGFQLLAVLFFLIVADAESVATTDPPDVCCSKAGYHHTLRFAIASSVYLAVGVAQWLFHVLYSHFFGSKLGQFVDLCSIANVSTFILEELYYGHYIHGRSIHGTAETNVLEMRAQLQKEEQGMATQRGLLPQTDDQTFEMHIPMALRQQWNNVFFSLLSEEQLTHTTHSSTDPGGEAALRGDSAGAEDRSVAARATINRFLAAFIDHTFRDLDYVVKDKFLLASLCPVVPDTNQHGVFYPDSGQGFASVLFYGNEWLLFTFDLMLFGLIDFLAESWVAAAVVVYVVQLVLIKVREVAGEANLARKTLVDSRFLV
eukprot:m.175519 g.175519  ORF g.175519 m.175519 type:complete len:968 (+) comp17921_c0_seq7:1121-4024(+)